MNTNKKTVTISITILIILILVLVKEVNYFQKGYLRVERVTSIETFWGNDSKFTYTKENNPEEIKNLVIAYNEAKPYDNSVGTTHDFRIEIKLVSGDIITVAGGSQGFQSAGKDGKQFNIKGDKLWNYFKQQYKLIN